ncbi:MAG: DUF4384 domain-containing protein [Cytophagales bacterium]|nr:DUF4384 domain-containing protein [Cytophagales bacterium]
MKIFALAFFLFVGDSAFGQLYSTGLVFNDEKYEKATIKAILNSDSFKELPTAVSLKKYCPKPGNQLQLNTSPSWATTWSAKSILEAQKNNWTNRKTITLNTLSPAFTYYYIREPADEKCETGADLYDALNFLKESNVKKYIDFLEFCPRSIPDDVIESGSKPAISDFTKLFDEQNPDQFKLSAVKKSLSEHLPVVIGMYCPPSFYRAKDFWQPTELVGTEYPGHALCVIGYDDAKYGGAFEIINSWGSLWGNNGFIWIRYKDFLKFTKYAYEVFDIQKSNDDTYDFSGSVRIKLNDNSEMEIERSGEGRFKTGKPFVTGTYFRLYLGNQIPAFVYVFGIDETNKVFRIFPHRENISPALVYKDNQVTIPGEDNYIEVIGEPGRERLCILYSKEALDFNQLLFNLEKYPGPVSEKLDALLEGKIISPHEIVWSEEGIQYRAKSKEKTAIFIQIQIDHI